ncbi:amidase family protein [Pseudomaricurvus hydrocarbonicus]|uniref:amidase family protein n=1 Tax=Pseudomaricurvus hydrocarbonicus TaxID=1470433 RepID=UPI003C7B06BB
MCPACGSSGGSAVAVGVLPVTHTTGDGGSIRFPAPGCGLFAARRGTPLETHTSKLAMVAPRGGDLWWQGICGLENCVSTMAVCQASPKINIQCRVWDDVFGRGVPQG